MATQTTNYNLTKPDGTDNYDIGVHNTNSDIIDSALAQIAAGLSTLSTKFSGHTHEISDINGLVAALAETAQAVKKVEITKATASIACEDNTEYLCSVPMTSLAFTFPETNFECWLSFTAHGSSDCTITFPTGYSFIGNIPDIEQGASYELSIKNKVIIMSKISAGE